MQRRLLLILIVAAVLIVGAIAAVWFVNRSPALQNSVLQLANVTTNSSATSNTNTSAGNANTNTAVDADTVARDYVARNFSESFGSGSSSDNFSNWEKAKPFITSTFSSFLERSFAQQRETTINGPYHAYVTKALVVATTKSSTTTASMVISTQRQETIETETSTYYQDLLLDAVKIGDDWKVNAAAWKPR